MFQALLKVFFFSKFHNIMISVMHENTCIKGDHITNLMEFLFHHAGMSHFSLLVRTGMRSFGLPSTSLPVVSTDVSVSGIFHTCDRALFEFWTMSSVAVERARRPRQEHASKSKDLFLREVRQIQELLELKTSELTSLQKELGREKRNTKEVRERDPQSSCVTLVSFGVS